MDYVPEQVFSQRTWPGVGDIDDCWVLSSIQCMNKVAPWLALPTATEFRKAANDPDDGNHDGGNVTDIMTGCKALWPRLPVRALNGVTWDAFIAAVKAANSSPISVAVVSGKLPAALQYGFAGLHQVSIFWQPGVGFYVANPLAKDRSAPTRIHDVDLRRATEAFGGGKLFGVMFPNQPTAFKRHPLYVDPAPPPPAGFTQEQMNTAVNKAVDHIAGIVPALTTAISEARAR